MTLRLSSWGSIAALLLIPAACSRKPERVVVRFWHAMGGESQTTLKGLVAEFESTNKAIRIELVGMGNYDALAQKLMGAVAAQDPPTIAQLYENWTTQLHANGELEYLDDYVHKPPDERRTTNDERRTMNDERRTMNVDLADIFPALLENNSWDGRLLTLPFNKSVPVYFYNVDILKRAGFDEFPHSWAEFRRMCLAVTKRDGSGKPLVWGTAGGTDIWVFGSVLFQRGGRFLDQEDGSPEFNGPAGVEALRFQVDLVHKDRVQNTDIGRNPVEDFLVQKLASLRGSSTWRSQMLEEERFPVGMAPLPGGTMNDERCTTNEERGTRKYDGRPAAIVYGTNIGMFRRAKPAEKDAAWKFIRWFLSPEQQVKWSLGTWYVPIYRKCLQDARIVARFRSTPGLERAYAQLDYGVFEPRGLKWLAGRKALVEEIEAAMLGQKTPQQALEDAAARYEQKQ